MTYDVLEKELNNGKLNSLYLFYGVFSTDL